ncbi:MAG: TIGR01777 family protein [Fibrobacteria bacterium]|nr:TIGR01777 family protein [Fibrobacteria bacterium]
MSVVVVAGSSGLVGTALVEALRQRGDTVRVLVRRQVASPGEYRWDPDSGQIPSEAVSGADAAIDLCGAGIGDARWTRERRRLIRSSRVGAARTLSESCARHGVPTFVSASATGFYGDRHDEPLDESSPSGGGFLADTCVAWEQAGRPAENALVRVVHVRLGVVLDRHGGALAKMLPAFRWGMGAVLGSGRQWFPWIALDDAVGAFLWALTHSDLHGPVLAVSPEPVRQAEFSRVLARSLRRPLFLRVPAWVLGFLLGGMGRELLLQSQRCRPKVLQGQGFQWRHPVLGDALKEILLQRPLR